MAWCGRKYTLRASEHFAEEVLAPLLRRMHFTSVRYTQGDREYGKDFTFSEVIPFGAMRHYGLQAKAGDITGEVNSVIDQIVGQADDAFKMPILRFIVCGAPVHFYVCGCSEWTLHRQRSGEDHQQDTSWASWVDAPSWIGSRFLNWWRDTGRPRDTNVEVALPMRVLTKKTK